MCIYYFQVSDWMGCDQPLQAPAIMIPHIPMMDYTHKL